MKTRRFSTAMEDLSAAASLLQQGENIAFPTETVYGLGGDARNDLAVAGIFDAKGRPRFNPLIVHVQDVETARKLAHFSSEASALADAFWPGALTLVLPLRKDAGLSPLVTAGLESVAIRVPSHPVAQDLLRAFGGPLAAPSANPSGKISATSADAVIEGLQGRIAGVVDAGPCEVGIESTIVGLTGDGPTLLRPGGIPAEAIEQALGKPLKQHVEGKINAPGQLASHYAPDAAIRLNAERPEADELWLGFGPADFLPGLSLSKTGDMREAAANLFHHLAKADQMVRELGLTRIAVAPVPASGLGLAINDRLSRAAAPRPE